MGDGGGAWIATAMENSVSLSVSQASSIRHLGATCETLTLGHTRGSPRKWGSWGPGDRWPQWSKYLPLCGHLFVRLFWPPFPHIPVC